jgi:hypothetical protein
VLEYQKIPGPFRRETEGPNRNKVIAGAWSSDALAATADLTWIWTEKVDGTNIRIHWDGHKVVYGGRTDNAQIPAKLIATLDLLVTEELFEQQFGETAATLYGEGYGAGVQKGGVYRPDMSFVLFDVRVGDWWLRRDDIENVGKGMGVDVVPVVTSGGIGDAIELVEHGLKSTWNPDVRAEGLVGVLAAGLLDRSGHRLICKVKAADFA